MSKKSPFKQNNAPQYQNSTMPSFLVSCYLMLMFSFFPYFLTDEYAHARTDKYYLYLVLSILLIVSVVIASVMDYMEERRVHRATLRFMPLSPADVSFLCFYGFAAISTLLSDNTEAAFFGIFSNNGLYLGGRNNGLLLMTFYLLVYLIITRRYAVKEYIIAVFLVFSSGVAFLAIVNYFYIDVLGIYTGYVDLWKLFAGEQCKPTVVLDFGSTLGNKNLISAFMCLFLPVAVMSLVLGSKRWLRIIGGVTSVFAYCGMLCADSLSGILGLIVILAVMAIFASREYRTMKRYLLALTVMFASGKLLRIFSAIMDDRSKGFEFVQQSLIYGKKVYFLIAVCAVLYLLMQVFEKKLEPRYPKKAVMITLIVLSAGGLAAGLFAFVYFSFINTEAQLSETLSGLLRFDENWGTHRGYYWIKSMDEYKNFSFVHKLFGTGPDSVYVVMEPCFPEMVVKFDEGSTDCVHNEFLNYFISQGILGLISYLALLGTVTVRALRRAKENPVVLIFLSAVICYAVQSVVNLYQPITTPLFFLFLTITEAINRLTPLKKAS